MPELDDALALARTMIAIGSTHGVEVVALVTAMDRPLGYAVGNALEMEEAILLMRGEGPSDLHDLTVEQAAEMLCLGHAAASIETARLEAEAALRDGRALEMMRRIVVAQGGNPAVLDDPALLPQADVRRTLECRESGYIAEVDALAIGQAAVALGAGRATLESRIDPAVGFHITARPGDAVRAGQSIATVFASDDAAAERGVRALAAAIHIAEEKGADPLPLVSHRVSAAGVHVP
jgi:thymidine phosphorylase